MLSGKNKQRFEEWLSKQIKQMNYNICQWNAFDLEIWNQQPLEFQKGVYEKYFDSLGYDIIIDVLINDADEKRYTSWLSDECIESCDTRLEAFTETVKQLDKLINK